MPSHCISSVYIDCIKDINLNLNKTNFVLRVLNFLQRIGCRKDAATPIIFFCRRKTKRKLILSFMFYYRIASELHFGPHEKMRQ